MENKAEMKVKPAIPFSFIGGGIGGSDRTLGREGSLSVSIKHRGTLTTLSSKKKNTTTVTAKKKAVTCAYGFCDGEYRRIGKVKQSYVKKFYQSLLNIPYIKHTNYNLFMKMCLLKMPELADFEHYSYLQRYLVLNDTPVTWTEQEVRLTEINVLRADGKDLQAFSINGQNRIIAALPHNVQRAGECFIKIAELKPFQALVVDVYSYAFIGQPDDYFHMPAGIVFGSSNNNFVMEHYPHTNFDSEPMNYIGNSWLGGVMYTFIELPLSVDCLRCHFLFGQPENSGNVINIFKSAPFQARTLKWDNMPQPTSGIIATFMSAPLGTWSDVLLDRPGRWLMLAYPQASAALGMTIFKGRGGRSYMNFSTCDSTYPVRAPYLSVQIGTRLL